MRKDNWKVNVNGKGLSASDIMTRVLNARGIKNIEAFLHPSGNILPFDTFKNIQNAANIFLKHLEARNHIMIYADVDADGCSSAAIMYHYLHACGVDCDTYINEKKEHGVKEAFLNVIHQLPTDLVIIVDSIDDTSEMYEKILSTGCDLIILDHHVPSEEILSKQERYNLVSSANEYPNPHLSGSGVTWKFCSYIDWIRNTNYAVELTDLATVGIIADVCDVGLESMENREICYNGFNNVVNSGIQAIIGSYEFNSDSVSFSIGPVINAANRAGKNHLALELFLTDNPTQAKSIFKDLSKIKEEQRDHANKLFEDFNNFVEPQKDNMCYVFFVDNTAESLAGLLATKACDKWKRPVLVLHDKGETYEGSMRATGIEDFRNIINKSGHATSAGHENSAGVVIESCFFEQVMEYLNSELAKSGFIVKEEPIDLTVERMQISPFLLQKMKEVNRITGQGFGPITVLVENVQKYTIKKMSQGKHLCVEVPDMKFLWWNFNNWDNVIDDGNLSAVGTLDESFFMGKRTSQMIVKDMFFSADPIKTTLW